MKQITIELTGEEEKVYAKMMENFRVDEFPKNEIHKRMFLRGMVEAVELINKQVRQRDGKNTPIEMKVKNLDTGEWINFGAG